MVKVREENKRITIPVMNTAMMAETISDEVSICWMRCDVLSTTRKNVAILDTASTKTKMT
jgi:hypothetical protein